MKEKKGFWRRYWFYILPLAIGYSVIILIKGFIENNMLAELLSPSLAQGLYLISAIIVKSIEAFLVLSLLFYIFYKYKKYIFYTEDEMKDKIEKKE